MAGSPAAAGDAWEWVRDAFLHPNLVADVLLSFRRRSRFDREAAEGDDGPSTSAPPPSLESLGWGRRIRRSPMMRIPRIFSAARREEEEEEEGMEDAGAATAATTETRKGKRRPSPQSPLEGYSSASASGDEEGARVERSAGVYDAALPVERHATVVVTNPRALSVPPIAIRRPSSKKMTKLELQTVERTLLEEKTNILKELERWRRAVDELRSNNVKLQAHRESSRKPSGFHTVSEDAQLPAKCQPVAPSSLPGRKDFIAIPDLNDPISD